MRHLILGLALLPLTATAGLVVEDEGEKPAVVVAAPAPAQVIIPVEIWKGEQGSTLSDSLQQWANRAKWVVIWDAFKGAEKVDYGLPAPVTFRAPSIARSRSGFVGMNERTSRLL